MNWQMSGAPESGGINACVVVVKDGALLAVMGVTPATFYANGAARKGAELTTWIVLPQARGLGLGRKMLAHLQDTYDVLAGAAISDAALPLYLSAGFTFQKYVPRFFYICDFDAVQVFADVSGQAKAITERRQGLGRQTNHKAQACAAADLADIAQAGLADSGCFRRDAAGLAWRYDAHPTYAYEAFVVTDHDAARSGVILREDRINGTPILHLVDLFGDVRDGDAALSFVEAEARRRGAAFVDISATSGRLNGLLRARGWSSAVDDPVIALPSLFHPVELRVPPTTSLVFWAKDRAADLFDFSALHVTKGDLDLDRPTLAALEQGTA